MPLLILLAVGGVAAVAFLALKPKAAAPPARRGISQSQLINSAVGGIATAGLAALTKSISNQSGSGSAINLGGLSSIGGASKSTSQNVSSNDSSEADSADYEETDTLAEDETIDGTSTLDDGSDYYA